MKAKTLLVLLLLSAACSTQDPYLGLTNRGILPLSDSDAFFSANVFLSQEMEQSSFLYNFIRTHGSPTAIELKHEGLKPMQMILFYAPSNEVYIGVPYAQHPGRQWIVRGPYQINWRDNREVQRLQKGLMNDPIFLVFDRKYRFPVARKPEPPKIAEPVLPPLPEPKPRRKRPVKKEAPKIIVAGPDTAPTPATFDPTNFKALNTDQQALMMAQGYAERAENGDLIHTVKLENETLDRVARWYTGSTANEAEIAKVDGLTPGAPLAKGTRVRVPLNLLKQFKVVPDDYK